MLVRKVSVKDLVNYSKRETNFEGKEIANEGSSNESAEEKANGSYNLVLAAVLATLFSVSSYHLLHETLYVRHDGNFVFVVVPEIPCT